MDIDSVNWSGERDGEVFQLDVNGLALEGCHWKCPSQTKHVLLFFHGMCSSVEFSANFLRVFPEYGCATMAVDHAGNGLSPGPRGSQTIEDIMDEASALIRYARAQYPTVPIFVMGHSMGGLAVIEMTLTGNEALKEVAGVIAHAPWITTNPARAPGWFKMTLLRMVSVVHPQYRIDTGLRPQQSKYAQGYKDLVASSKYYFSFMTARLANSVFHACNHVQAHAQDYCGLPILILQGRCDDCVDVSGSVQWFESLRGVSKAPVHVKVFENGLHDLLKAATREEAFKDILAFLADPSKQV